MTQTIDYTGIKNSIATILATDVRLDTTNVAQRYIRQMLKQRWIEGSSLPVVLIYLISKPSEQHMAIGYSPFPIVIYGIKTVLQLPPNVDDAGNSEIPDALLTQIGETDLQTAEQADNALEAITNAIEEVLRGNSGGLSANRYLNNNNVKVALPVETQFNFIKAENRYYLFSEIQLRVEMRLVTV